MKKMGVIFRLLTIFKGKGGYFGSFPLLHRMERKSALCILGGEDIRAINLHRLIGDAIMRRFMFLQSYGSSPHTLSLRILATETAGLPTMILIPPRCLPHIASNAAKYPPP